MVIENKVFIIGGRSGTTLMQKLLMVTGEFRNWHHKNVRFNPKIHDPIAFAKKRTQTPYGNAWEIFKTFPDVPDSVLKPMERFTICKLPEFDLVIDKIIKMYKDPIFIVMEIMMRGINWFCYKTMEIANKY